MKTPEILDALGRTLNALPDVFSTPQWGGRAYKIRRGSRDKLVAFLGCDDDGGVHVSFKLPPARAEAVVERHEWIEPHAFRTLAPSGWVTALARTKRHAGTLERLLAESRALHGEAARGVSPSPRNTRARDASRIDEVMGAVTDWTPKSDW